jgi:hypothetical protein
MGSCADTSGEGGVTADIYLWISFYFVLINFSFLSLTLNSSLDIEIALAECSASLAHRVTVRLVGSSVGLAGTELTSSWFAPTVIYNCFITKL